MTAAVAPRGAFLAVVLGGLAASALAEPRPPPRGHATVELTNPDGGTASPGARFIATLSASAQTALKKDSQVLLEQQTSTSGPSLVKAVVRLNRPKAEVYAVLSAPSEQHTFLPHVQVSKTFGGRTDEGENVDFVLAFVFTFKYRTQHWFYPDESRIEWKLDPAGGDGLVEQLGFWQLYELDEKTTIAEYGTHIVARGAILNFFRSLGERGAIADALSAVRTHVDGPKKK